MIHCWMNQSIIQGLVAARLSGIPCLSSPRNVLESLDYYTARFWEKRLFRKSVQRSDLVVFPSFTVAIDFVDSGWVEPARTRVVYNGVDEIEFQPGFSGEAIVAVGRIAAEKAPEDLEETAQQIHKQMPGIRFIVAGGGNPPPSKSIEFVGRVDDIRQILRQAAVVIHTSRFEGMSNALLEAQSMGIPVIARRNGANTETVVDGVTGILADTNDELARACVALLTDQEMRNQMGAMARKRILSGFTIAGQVKKNEALYNELL